MIFLFTFRWHKFSIKTPVRGLFIYTGELEMPDESQRVLKNTKYINNWDLVDLSAHYIFGDYLINKDRNILEKLAI